MNRFYNAMDMLERIFDNDLSVIYNQNYFVDDVDDKITLEIPVPGFTKEKISVETEDGVLIVEGKGEDSRWAKDFIKKFKMPNSLDPSKNKATIENGILKVEFDKKKESLPKKIKIL